MLWNFFAWVLPFMWMLPRYALYHQPQHCCRPCTTFSWKHIFPDVSRIPVTKQICFRNGLRNKSKVIDCPPITPYNLFSNCQIYFQLGCTGETSLIHGRPTSQLAGLKRSSAHVVVPDCGIWHTFRGLVP